MPTVTPPSLTPTPTPAPQRNDRGTFSARFDAFITWFILFVTEVAALAANVYNNALDAFSSATAASNSAANAAASASIATGAVATSGAVLWNAATNYSIGNTVYSPITLRNYRRRTSGVFPTDPSNDGTNWVDIGGVGGMIRYAGSWFINAVNICVTSAVSSLPDLTTVTDSFGISVAANSVSVPTSLTTSDGWTISPAFVQGQTGLVMPLNRATAHGVWGSLTTLPPVLATLSVGGVATIYATVAMPNNILVVFYLAASSTYAVAVDTVNNLIGAPVFLGGSGQSFLAAFQDTATTLVVNYQVGTNSTVAVLTLSAGTALALGTPLLTSSLAAPTAINAPMVKLTTGFYVTCAKLNQNVIGVNGTTCNRSAEVQFSGGQVAGLMPLSSTTALIAGQGASASATQGGAVITAGGTTSAPTIALGTTNVTGVCNTTYSFRGLIPFDATRFLLYGQNVAGTGASMYLLTVSGVTVSLGTVLDNTQIATWPSYTPVTYAVPRAQKFVTYSATQILHGVLGGAAIISYSGSVLIAGSAQLSGQTAGNFQRDFSNTTWFYVGSTAFDVFTISGSTITSSEQIAATPTVFMTATVNNRVAKYSGTWYTQNLNAVVPVSTTKALAASGSNLLLNGALT